MRVLVAIRLVKFFLCRRASGRALQLPGPTLQMLRDIQSFAGDPRPEVPNQCVLRTKQGGGNRGGCVVGIALLPPTVSIVAPFCGLTKSILRILNGNPQKEIQWRLYRQCLDTLFRMSGSECPAEPQSLNRTESLRPNPYTLHPQNRVMTLNPLETHALS